MHLWLIMDENSEFAEAALHVVLIEINKIYVARVIDVFTPGNHRDVELARPVGVRQILIGNGIFPTTSLGLDYKRAEKTMCVGAPFGSTDIGQIIDRPNALAHHIDVKDALAARRASAVAVVAQVAAICVVNAVAAIALNMKTDAAIS